MEEATSNTFDTLIGGLVVVQRVGTTLGAGGNRGNGGSRGGRQLWLGPWAYFHQVQIFPATIRTEWYAW